MTHHLSLTVTKDISFIQPTVQAATKLFHLIDTDRIHLGEFLNFVKATQSATDTENFLKMKITGEANGTDRFFLIYYKNELAGLIDLNLIDQKNKHAEIGYWIHSSFSNKGIISTAVTQIIEIAFEDLALNKVSIIAIVENIASNKVAQKTGFEFVATLREEHFLYGEFRDINRYSLLKNDFYSKKNKSSH